MMNPGMFSSLTCEWATPQAVFDELNSEFQFDMDVCAMPENAKCERFFDARDLWSSLAQKWSGMCWMNPPYGRELIHWVAKAHDSAKIDCTATVVCLLPSRTDTAWWHDYVMKADDVRFIRGRLKFGGAEYNAPFPSAVVVFRSDTE